MKSRWNGAAAPAGALAQCAYAARLLGEDPTLALAGCGSVSAKLVEPDLWGVDQAILYVSGGDADLAALTAADLVPLRRDELGRLAQLPDLPAARLAGEMAVRVLAPGAPQPPLAALLHALLPDKFVFYLYPDALLAITNTPSAADHVRRLYGATAAVLPYARPGLPLAQALAGALEGAVGPDTAGLVLLRQGLIAFGETALAAYERMINLVNRAEDYLREQGAWQITVPDLPPPEVPPRDELDGSGKPKVPQRDELDGSGKAEVPPSDELAALRKAAASQRDELAALRKAAATQRGELAALRKAAASQRGELAGLRKAASAAAGFPVIMATHSDALSLHFARRDDLAEIVQRGPVAPWHAQITRGAALRLPLLGRDAAAFGAAGEQDGEACPDGLDVLPRVILDPELGLCTIGRSAEVAVRVAEVYRHTIEIILRAETLEEYRPTSVQEVGVVEFGEPGGGKLSPGSSPLFAGEVALVTGAASGIGQACIQSFLDRGAAAVGLDVNPDIVGMLDRPDYLGLCCDVTDEAAVCAALEATVRAFGGLDMLVLNAGVFPAGRRIDSLSLEEWNRVMRVNLDANLTLLREAHPLLKLAPAGGRVVINGSRNVLAPGPGAAAYSTSKAALTQLARVAALEWGQDNIRVNMIHAHAVFDTGIWTPEVLCARAEHYGLTVEEYKTKNVLCAEITSHDVAELVAEMCGPLFAKTTGAQVPIDGGCDRVI